MLSGTAYRDLSAKDLLLAAEDGVASRRSEEVNDLLRLLAWADLNSVDPTTQPGRAPASMGGPKLVRLGGSGTPEVVDTALPEMAIARQTGVAATRNAMSDALDLRHRLPNLYAALLALKVEPWVARRVASNTRKLTVDQVALVDLGVADAVDQSPARLLAIAGAKILEAQSSLPDEDGVIVGQPGTAPMVPKRGVTVTHPTPGVDDPHAPAHVDADLDRGDAFWFEQTIDELADVLRDRDLARRAADLAQIEATGDDTLSVTQIHDRDHYRAQALALLAHPAEAARLLAGDDADSTGPTRDSTVFTHIHAETLLGLVAGIARVEDLGPLLVAQLSSLLGGTNVTLAPVIDLNAATSVNSYEHPLAVKIRTQLRTAGDVFPHSSHLSGPVDHDHATPYDPNGPPGQTGDHNDAPLTRHHHRAKTHELYRVVHLGPGRYLWLTPHGLARLVDHRGTHVLDATHVRWLDLGAGRDVRSTAAGSSVVPEEPRDEASRTAA